MTRCASDSSAEMEEARRRFDDQFFSIMCSLDLIDDPEFMHMEELAIWEEFFARTVEEIHDIQHEFRDGRVRAVKLA